MPQTLVELKKNIALCDRHDQQTIGDRIVNLLESQVVSHHFGDTTVQILQVPSRCLSVADA